MRLPCLDKLLVVLLLDVGRSLDPVLAELLKDDNRRSRGRYIIFNSIKSCPIAQYLLCHHLLQLLHLRLSTARADADVQQHRLRRPHARELLHTESNAM